MHQHLGRIILGGDRRFENGVDPLCICSLEVLSVLRRVQQRLEFMLWCGNGAGLRKSTAVNQVSGNLISVGVLFGGLLVEIAREALQILLLAPKRQCAVIVSGS